MSNVILWGAIYDTDHVDLPKSGGGTVRFSQPTGAIDITENGVHDVTNYATARVYVPTEPTGGSDLVPYAIRPDAELIHTYTYDRRAVADLGLTLPAYTTASKTLKASGNLSPTIALNLTQYRYFVAERFLTIPEYDSGTTIGKGYVEYQFCTYLCEITRLTANMVKAITDSTKSITSGTNIVSTSIANRLLYWSSSTALAMYNTNSTGVYQTATAPSISGNTMTVKYPALCVKGHATYFPSTYMDALSDIRYQYVIEVYRSPAGNLNIDGWGHEQSLQHVIGCINSDSHVLT